MADEQSDREVYEYQFYAWTPQGPARAFTVFLSDDPTPETVAGFLRDIAAQLPPNTPVPLIRWYIKRRLTPIDVPAVAPGLTVVRGELVN